MVLHKASLIILFYSRLRVYVDDIILTGLSYILDSLKLLLNQQFKLKDLDALKYFLGLEIVKSSSGIVLSQRNYTLKLLEDTGYLSSKQVNIPMDPKVDLSFIDGDALEDSYIIEVLLGSFYISLSLARTLLCCS